MNNQSLNKFKAKVAIESLVKALLFAAMCMLGAMAIFAIALNVFNARVLDWVVILSIIFIGLVAMGGSFAFFFLKVFKTKDEQVAMRVDGLGFEERAVTMVEFSDDESFIAQKQREDAEEKLSTVEPKSVKFRVPVMAIVLCAVMIVASAIILPLTLPKVMANSDEVRANKIISQMVTQLRTEIKDAQILPENKEELNNIIDEFLVEVRKEQNVNEKIQLVDQLATEIRTKIDLYSKQADSIINQLIEDLKNTVADSEVNDKVREELNKVISDLEADLKTTTTVSEKIDKIEVASDKIEQIISENKTHDDAGQQMQDAAANKDNQALKDLAEAIESGNSQKAQEALDKLNQDMQAATDKETLDKLVNDVTEVLDKGTENLPKDELTDAMKELSDALKNAQKEPSLPEEKIDIQEAMNTANKNIADALKQQTEQKNTESEMQKVIDEAKDKLGELPNDPNAPKETMDDIQQIIDQAKEDLNHIVTSNTGSGSNDTSGSNSGLNSGSGSGSGSNSGSGSGIGSNSGSGSGGSGSMSGSGSGSTPGSNSGSGSAGSGSIKGSNSGSGSGSTSGSTSGNPGSSSGSGTGNGSTLGEISTKPIPTVVDGVTTYEDLLADAEAEYDAYLKSGDYDEAQLKSLEKYIQALKDYIELQ